MSTKNLDVFKINDAFLNYLEGVIQSAITKSYEEIPKDYEKKYFKKKEAAAYIGISFNTLKKFIEAGLPTIEVDGVQMIRREDIDNFLESKIK